LNVFRSLTRIYAQVIDDQEGRTLVSASSLDQELKAELEGLSKKDQAFKIGQAVAKRAIGKGVKRVIFDRGGYKYIGRVKALADGARDGGLEF
jgi:large subunit ribosomal protein L18